MPTSVNSRWRRIAYGLGAPTVLLAPFVTLMMIGMPNAALIFYSVAVLALIAAGPRLLTGRW